MIAAMLALAAAAAPFSCGAVERPGIAMRGEDGIWRGAAVDLCRTRAMARHGPGTAIAFHAYRTTAELREAKQDNFAVLSGAELAVATAAASPPLGPPVAVSRQVLLVGAGSPLHDRAELAGHRLCFIVATAGEAALNAWARPAGLAIDRVGFQETVELRDAFDAGYCAAMAVDADDVPGGPARTQVLGEPLAEVAMFEIKFQNSYRLGARGPKPRQPLRGKSTSG